MRFRTLEIRWHDSKPISSCDFQPVAFKKARPPVGQEKNYAAQVYRLATAGEDNHVRIWMIHPNIMPVSLVESTSTSTPVPPRPARVEYLATLSRHSAAVNVVRFSPNGDLIASAGDDGMIIIWAPSNSPHTSTYGSDLSPEELQHEKEYWKPRTTFRCTTMQVYDLAWSPSGEYIIAGSTDNAARVFTSADGKCVHEIAEHNHYVQGVAWDPLNEYIATQSSDRSMHVYSISTKPGAFEAHAIGRNTRMSSTHHHHSRHSRTPSSHGSRPRMFRRESTASDAESVVSEFAIDTSNSKDVAPLTPSTSVASTPSISSSFPSSMFPPPPVLLAPDKQSHPASSSRRSSFSSNAPSSPATFGNNNNNNNAGRYARSPSPMPALPAIRTNWKLYGDESFSNFFRRLTFSPDGGLLMTPAGQFEDPAVVPGARAVASSSKANAASEDGTPTRGRKGRPSISTAVAPVTTSSSNDVFGINPTSSVYIYSRANFARPPIAQLPGHKKASVAVRFSPVLYELRPGVGGGSQGVHEARNAVLERSREGNIDVDVMGPSTQIQDAGLVTPQRTPSHSQTHTHSHPQGLIAAPAPLGASSAIHIGPSLAPVLSPNDMRPPTPAASKPSTPVPPSSHLSSGITTGSVFALPYRMLFAVVTMDTIAIYDTQQSGPVCLLTKLHYDEFTDITWSPDGQCLILSSRDGYCTLIIFDEILPAHHTQQHTLQLQSIAQHHSVPLTVAASASHSHTSQTPISTPITANVGLPSTPTPSAGSVVPQKRSEPPLTPAASVDGDARAGGSTIVAGVYVAAPDPGSESETRLQEPPKKKRRVVLTKVADLDS